MAAGCDEVLHKPFRSHGIFDAMQRQLGVCYRYAETAVQPDKPVEVSAEAVAALPAELREALRKAAKSLNDEGFEAALVSVHERDPALADGLAALAREFRFDRILVLLGKQTSEGL